MSSQQSWAAWLLDAYASAVSAAPVEPTHDDDEADLNSSSGPPSNVNESSSSPYGPYLKTGRGGAGNFTWQSQDSQQPQGGDLEAQKPSTLSERRRAAAKVEHIDTGAAIRTRATQRQNSQFVRVGRGFVQSNEIQQSPRSASSAMQSPTLPIQVSSPSISHPGRGGAGNLVAANELKEKAEREKQIQREREAEMRRGQIEEEVQNSLLPPPDAWLGGRRPSDHFPDTEG